MINCFFIILLFVVMPVYADLNNHDEINLPFKFKTPDDAGSYQAIDHKEEYLGCSGYLRFGYIQTDHKSASAIGGKLGCGYPFNSTIKAHIGLFSSINPGLNSENDLNIQSDFFNQQKDSYLIVGEAFLTLSYKQFDTNLGRQKFYSPHLDSDGLRMIPNLFEAYLFDYHFSDALTLGTGYIREVAGWENAANASQFVSIGEALGGRSNGAFTSWVKYQPNDISTNTWFYLIPDHISIFYTEFIYTQVLSDTLSYNLGFQYDWGHDVGASRLGEIDANTLGIMASVTWSDVSFTTAYNKNLGQTGAIASAGGGPFFTSVEDQTLDAVSSKNAESILLSVEYHLTDYIQLGSAVAKFNAQHRKNYNKEELDLFINLNWEQDLNLELMYAVVDDLNSEPDLHQVRAILTFQY